jgi:putative hydrolase of the HAD superfamily
MQPRRVPPLFIECLSVTRSSPSTDCVFFDAGDTLIHPVPDVGEAYAAALARRGIVADPDEMLARFQRLMAQRTRRDDGRLRYGTTEAEARAWWRLAVRRCFAEHADEIDLDEVFEELWSHFARGDAWRVYPDVARTFDALRHRGIKIGLVSNWDCRLPPLLQGLGLWDMFDVPVVSFQVGVEKPDPAIFEHALRAGGATPERCVHVGDSYEQDVVGARRAGIRPVWLRRRGEGEKTARDVKIIRSLDEVLRLLA